MADVGQKPVTRKCAAFKEPRSARWLVAAFASAMGGGERGCTIHESGGIFRQLQRWTIVANGTEAARDECHHIE